jgi:hypothetical protein
MEIAVDGWRPDATDWDGVRNLPPEKIPVTEQQREVAKSLGLPEVDYAKSALAGEKSQERLLAKTERFARLLTRMLNGIASPASVEKVTLRIYAEKFDVLLRLSDHALPLKISESLVDDLFESGSEEAEKRLARILDTAVGGRNRPQ